MNQPQMYESASISVFFPNMAAFILSPHVLITYAWFIAVNVFAYSISFHNQPPCNGYRELYSGRNIDFILKNYCPARPLFYFFGLAVRFESN